MKLYLVNEIGPTSFLFKDENENKFKVSSVATSGHNRIDYQLLLRNRQRKGRALRLSLDYLHQVAADHAGRLRMFELRLDDELVAAALEYRLLDDVESVQYWGDDAPDLGFSPMPQLAYHVMHTASREGIRILDLGKSSVDGVPDEGLVQFKRGLGAVPEPLLVVERHLG